MHDASGITQNEHILLQVRSMIIIALNKYTVSVGLT